MKAKGKKIVAYYHGTEWRRSNGPKPAVKELADVCVVATHEMQRYAPAERIFIGFDTDKFQPVERRNKKIFIGHNTSDRWIKGTDKIEEVFERLKKRYDIETVVIENVSNQECMRIKQRLDIYVDQILTRVIKNGKSIAGYGTSAIEAMSFGIPVLSYLDEKFMSEYPDHPIIHVDFDTLEGKLAELIENKSLREEMGMRSRQWVVKNHDLKVIVSQWRDLYRRLGFYND
jgi:glycosyltransferase involved in cell wall biosynthesis